MKLIEQAIAFSNAYNIPVMAVPVIQSPRMCVVRQMLIQKQIEDFSAAWYEKDIDHVRNSLAHCIYMLAVTCCEFGVHIDLEATLDDIHRDYLANAASRAQMPDSRPNLYSFSI